MTSMNRDWAEGRKSGNNGPLLSDNRRANPLWLLNNTGIARSVFHMKHAVLILAFLASASAAQAECYADYKAKRDNPLQLQYGVAQVSDSACSKKAAARELAPKLKADGWTLLTVLSTFGAEGLEQRKASAGQYFLRY